jgi:predicted transcriptional regulator of viral defense system
MRIHALYGGEGWLRVHMGDADQYEITDDNGVDVDLSPAQIKRIVRWALNKAPGMVKRILKGVYLITDADIAELIDYADAEDGPACIRSLCEKIKARGRS